MQQITKEWTNEMATALRRTAEALLNAKRGSLKEFVRERSLLVASSVTLTGVATLVGTAGTGAAIGTLHGAAFYSAFTAWIGFGSVTAGLAILPVVVGGGGYLAYRALFGKTRKFNELSEEETGILTRCVDFACHLQNKAGKDGENLSLPPEDVDTLKKLEADIKTYLSGDNCKSRHVRKKTTKRHGELSKLLGDLG